MKKILILAAVAAMAVISFVSCKAATPAITGKQWNLTEVAGESVTIARLPFLKLNAADTKISGNTGCNNFFGTYELGKKGKITFSGIGMTRMFCIDSVVNIVENKFSGVFEKVATYTATENELILNNKDGIALAKFKAAETPKAE